MEVQGPNYGGLYSESNPFRENVIIDRLVKRG